MKSAVYVILRFLLWLPATLLFRVHWKDRGNEPKRSQGPYLLCANHQTVLDVVFMALVLRRQQPHFMAKAELFKVPVLGWLVRKLGAFPVSRGKGDVGAVKHAVSLLKEGRSVGMFPQGTRCQGKELRDCKIKFGAGLIAAHAKVQVLPVYIKMKDRKWKFFRRVDVIVGKPIPFEELDYREGESGEYARMTEVIYDRICQLDEAHP
ncbi:MAG: 1-acyl-sn-glycerol-3-phosphate acyltransferase [Clostridia bacterium]|nr:1-acyl-sn-glycerol-3-phosphate acyltransferase [Clostridia bacterium]